MENAKCILVVDDDPEIVEAYKTALEEHGYEVRTAYSGETGLEAYRENTPDLVVLDIMMEEVDSGLKVAREIAGAVPVILLSGIADPLTQEFDVFQLPVREILGKPVDPEALAKKVGEIV